MFISRATRLAAIAGLAVMGLTVPAAQSSVDVPARNSAHPKAWPAVAGLSAPQVVRLAATVPAGSDAPDMPWCDATAAVHQALDEEFGERLVAAGDDGVQLWGSGREGTWTMVLPRPDATSCVVVSGIGFRDATAPDTFFRTAGLG